MLLQNILDHVGAGMLSYVQLIIDRELLSLSNSYGSLHIRKSS
jgi:hypothetical protein